MKTNTSVIFPIQVDIFRPRVEGGHERREKIEGQTHVKDTHLFLYPFWQFLIPSTRSLGRGKFNLSKHASCYQSWVVPMYRLLNHLLYISFEAKHSTSRKSDRCSSALFNSSIWRWSCAIPSLFLLSANFLIISSLSVIFIRTERRKWVQG